MKISEIDYVGMTEQSLLRIVLLEYAVAHPSEKPEHAIASIAGCSSKHIYNCLSGETHLGIEAWFKVSRAIRTQHFVEWLRAKSFLYVGVSLASFSGVESPERQPEDAGDVARRGTNGGGNGRTRKTNPVQRVRTIRPGDDRASG